MKQIIIFLAFLLAVIAATAPSYAGFYVHGKTVPRVVEAQQQVQTSPHATPRKEKGALAWIAAGCAVLGLALISPHTVLLIFILGTLSGVFGRLGLNLYKHNKFYRFLCIASIILGAFLVLLAMVPLLLFI